MAEQNTIVHVAGRSVIQTLLVSLLLLGLASCNSAGEGGDTQGAPYIAVISKGETHEFWQQVSAGASAAATEVGAEVTYDGPDSGDFETNVTQQKTMLQAALEENPTAIALATLDTSAVLEEIEEAQDRDIPIIGFDSGVPNAPSGAVLATASTDNSAAGAVAAEKMFPELETSIESATSGSPVRLTVLNVNTTAVSVVDRTTGFRDRMIELITTETSKSASNIAVEGNDVFIDGDSPTSGQEVFIRLLAVGAYGSNDTGELATAEVGNIASDGIVGLFCTNEGTANALLDATNDGADLPGVGVVAIGFDAGSQQKTAVQNEYFLGSIVQDSYGMGYDAVTLAYQATQGGAVTDDLNPGVYYDHANMNDQGIANLLYD